MYYIYYIYIYNIYIYLYIYIYIVYTYIYIYYIIYLYIYIIDIYIYIYYILGRNNISNSIENDFFPFHSFPLLTCILIGSLNTLLANQPPPAVEEGINARWLLI